MIHHFIKKASLPPPGSRIVVALSGGVDSGVCAYLCSKYCKDSEIIGVQMKTWDVEDEIANRESRTKSDNNLTETSSIMRQIGSFCEQEGEDMKSAQKVCTFLGIEFKRMDMVKDYWNHVFDPYIESFEEGGTPNPDIYCNSEIKFNRFQNKVLKQFNADYLVTGHYARIGDIHLQRSLHSKDIVYLRRGVDPVKDQSYFLSGVNGNALKRAYFPLGEFHKKEVREFAREVGLPNASKPDSYGICFVGKRKFSDFIREYRPNEQGDFVCADTNVALGKHQGFDSYTVGQKAKIKNMDDKYYVVGKDISKKIVLVAKGRDNPRLFSKGLTINEKDLNIINKYDNMSSGKLVGRFNVQIRSRQEGGIPSTITYDESERKYSVIFDKPAKSVNPQQICAIYDFPTNNTCYGGGKISSTIKLVES